MSVRQITSIADLNSRVEPLKPKISLPETEDSWETIAKALKSFTDLCQNGACDFPAELITILRSISRPLTSSMVSERTRLSGVAFELTSVVAAGLGRSFDAVLPIFFPVLMSLCGRTNKVIITRARACIAAIVEATQLPSILPYFLQSIKDKSTSIRLAAAEGTLSCMNCFNPPDLEKDSRARDIETVIRTTAKDTQGEIRAVSRKLFEAYRVLLPNRVDSFAAPLSPTMKKYLDIKPAATVHTELSTTRQKTTSDAKTHLSSSTSAMSSSSSRGRTESRPLAHVRSASSSVLSNDRRTAVAPAKISTETQAQRKPGKTDMAPPLLIPVRPTQPSRNLSTSRSTSSVEPRGRVVSAQAVRPAAPPGNSRPSTRPTSANSHNEAPQRPQTLAKPLSGTQELSTGPRRVPISEAQASEARKPPKVDATRTRVVSAAARPLSKEVQETQPVKPRARVVSAASRPISTDAKLQANAAPTGPTREKAKPVPKVTSVAKAVDVPAKIAKPGGLTQPTLSQLSRAKAIADRKPPLAAPKGRSDTPKPTASTFRQPATATQQGKVKPGTGSSKPIKAAQIPLPPSPQRSTAQLLPGDIDRQPTPVSEAPAAPLIVPVTLPDDEPEPAVEPTASRTTGDGDVTPPSLESLEHAPPVLIEVPPTPSAADDEEEAADNNAQDSESLLIDFEASRLTDDHVEPALSVPDLLTGQPSTPHVLRLSDNLSDSPTKTPISSLLSSIQRGFLFTPSSPLSPPQSYLARGGMQDLPIPFPLNVDGSEDNSAHAKKPFMFGVAGDDYGRSTLGNVENLNVHK
ncbi:hypothetical protein DXG03_003914 [Asterophora parasitica]|uniref:TOG domain-containing protein n=1 Tax=Asterophora parasitica TaxID=117018 RepID=A0A9P7GG33_9AGAR|nr:hypothetical protein DXG03_003914 [Asterophora parasitica]